MDLEIAPGDGHWIHGIGVTIDVEEEQGVVLRIKDTEEIPVNERARFGPIAAGLIAIFATGKEEDLAKIHFVSLDAF